MIFIFPFPFNFIAFIPKILYYKPSAATSLHPKSNSSSLGDKYHQNIQLILFFQEYYTIFKMLSIV